MATSKYHEGKDGTRSIVPAEMRPQTHTNGLTTNKGLSTTNIDNQNDLPTFINDVTIEHSIYSQDVFLVNIKGNAVTEKLRVPNILVMSIEKEETLFSPFHTIKLTYQSKNGYAFERLSIEDYKSATNSGSPKLTYVYDSGLYNRIDLLLKKREINAKTFPMIDDRYVVKSKTDTTPFDIQNDKGGDSENAFTTLELIPEIQMILDTTTPEYTTGHDTNHGEKSGKLTGEAIMDILKACGAKVNEQKFDKGKTKINFTAMMNMTAMDCINYIMQFHMSEKEGDACFLRYDYINKEFTLRSIADYFRNDDQHDEFGTFEKIPLNVKIPPNEEVSKSIPIVATKYEYKISNDYNHDIATPYPVVTTHYKNTFVIDGSAYKTAEIAKDIGEMYTAPKPELDMIDRTRLISDFIDPTKYKTMDITFTPHPGADTRKYFGYGKLRMLKGLTSMIMTYNAPGFDMVRQAGRKFMTLMPYGAIDDYSEKALGVYLMMEVHTLITNEKCVQTTTGVKCLKALQNGFRI